MSIKYGNIFLASLLILSCKHPAAPSHTSGIVQGSSYEFRWPQPNNIPVCWEAPQIKLYNLNRVEFDASQLAAVQAQIESKSVQEFFRAGLKLVGWKDCKPKSPGIRLLLGNEDIALGVGRKIDGAYGGVQIAITESTIAQALHEMGHALGLRHEHNRIEAAQSCRSFYHQRFYTNEVNLGPYDSQSIMNYCRYDNDVQIEGLSQGDVKSLREIYFGVIAKLDREIPPSLPANKDLKFLVQDAKQYRYKLIRSGKGSCLEETGYSKFITSDQALTVTGSPEEQKTLCLSGKSGQVTQKQPTQYNLAFGVTIVNMQWPGRRLFKREGGSLAVLVNSSLSSDGAETYSYKYSLEGNENFCQSSKGYTTVKTTKPLIISALPIGPDPLLVDICVAANTTERHLKNIIPKKLIEDKPMIVRMEHINGIRRNVQKWHIIPNDPLDAVREYSYAFSASNCTNNLQYSQPQPVNQPITFEPAAIAFKSKLCTKTIHQDGRKSTQPQEWLLSYEE